MRDLIVSHFYFMKGDIMDLKYSIDHIPKNTPYNRRPAFPMQPQYITIHSTGIDKR